ncbi:TetR/AcrR family transcriptional regulator [bacterium]|nr:TetR/AcrR family transcriptional regulator [bacterium]
MTEGKKTIITKVARQIFSRYGFLKTTVDDIAKAARIGKASIYHYFRSKEDLFENVVEQEYQLLIEKTKEAINRETTPKKKINAYIINRMKYLNELSNVYSALKDEYLEHYAFTEKIRERHFNKEMEILQTILEGGVEQGIFEIKDINLTTFAILSALKGLEYPWSINTSMPEIEENLEKLLELLFNGIVKR